MTKYLGSRILVAAVSASLAMAQDPGSETPVKVSYKSGEGLNFDAGDKFSATLFNYVQAGWMFANNENFEDFNDFGVARVRTALRGHAYSRNVQYFLQLDWLDDGSTFERDGDLVGITDGPVRDAWVQWDFMTNGNDAVGLRVGQGKSYHGFEATGFAAGFFFVDRSIASQAFGTARSQGAWLHGKHMDNRLRWNFGAQNGDVAGFNSGLGDQSGNDDNEVTFVANASFDLLGDFYGGDQREFMRQGNWADGSEVRGTVGGGIMMGNGKFEGADNESMQLNFHTAWAFGGGFGAFGEIFIREDDVQGGGKADSSGFNIQGMWIAPKSGNSDMRWGIGLRYSEVKDDDGFLAASLAEGTPPSGFKIRDLSLVGNLFYAGHNCKTQVEYTMRDNKPDGGGSTTDHIFGVMFQLGF